MNLDNMREMLIANEGLSLKLYKCTAGITSIGVGRAIQTRGISEDEAMFMLTNDIEICIAALDKRYPWWKRLSEARQEVMVDLMFNLENPAWRSSFSSCNQWKPRRARKITR